MELRQLKTFKTVASLMSFNRAAETLNYAQSTVSAQIKAMEEELDKPLFNRLGRKIVLTDAGHLLLRYAQKILLLEEETITQVAGWEESHGSINIRIPQSLSIYVLPPLLKEFARQYPKVGFHVDRCAATIDQELRSGIIDLAFLLADSIHTHDLDAEVLGYAKLFMVASPHHALAQQSSIQLKDLDGVSILLPKQDCSYKMSFEQMLVEEKVNYASIMEFNSIEALKRCVINNVGIAMIPEMAIRKEVTSKQLVVLPWPEEEMETAILMIRHKDKWLSPALQIFMNILRDHFSES